MVSQAGPSGQAGRLSWQAELPVCLCWLRAGCVVCATSNVGYQQHGLDVTKDMDMDACFSACGLSL
jgi:hypothetical protein